MIAEGGKIISKELSNKIYNLIELVKEKGKIKKGTNEVTKIVERGGALLVVMAADVNPPEILAHMPILCEEKNVPFVYVSSKMELGFSIDMEKPTASLVLLDVGNEKDKLEEVLVEIKKLENK